MISITNGFGVIASGDADITLATYDLPQEIILEDEEAVIFEGCD